MSSKDRGLGDVHSRFGKIFMVVWHNSLAEELHVRGLGERLQSRNTDEITTYALGKAFVLVFKFLESAEAVIVACDDKIIVMWCNKVRHDWGIGPDELTHRDSLISGSAWAFVLLTSATVMVKRDKTQSSKQPPVSLILPTSLYLGPCSAASSKQFLTTNAITTVLSVGASPSGRLDGVTYHRVSLSDSPSSSIANVCDAACTIIDAALNSRNGTGKILVHCSAGISRSPMVVAAYLMKRRHMSLKAALRQILQARPQVSPNPGFLQQLKYLEMELFGSVTLDVDSLPRSEKERLALFAEPEESDKNVQDA